jgi:hypothetical protein
MLRSREDGHSSFWGQKELVQLFHNLYLIQVISGLDDSHPYGTGPAILPNPPTQMVILYLSETLYPSSHFSVSTVNNNALHIFQDDKVDFQCLTVKLIGEGGDGYINEPDLIIACCVHTHCNVSHKCVQL